MNLARMCVAGLWAVAALLAAAGPGAGQPAGQADGAGPATAPREAARREAARRQRAQAAERPREAPRPGRVTYAGRSADAPWRAAAAERIEKHRKADLLVKVVGADGAAVADAKVHLRQQRHAFGFGNILGPEVFMRQGPDGATYRRVFLDHFNKVTFEQGFRWQNWFQTARRGRLDGQKKVLDEMIRFCQDRRIPIRGHYLAWAPLTPEQYKPTNYMQQPEKLWPELSAHIDEMLAFDSGRLAEWDAVNHIVGWYDTMATAAGSDEIYAKIILHARSKTNTPLWVNEGGILPGGTRAEPYEKMIQGLFDRKAAPDGIGFMAHFKDSNLRPINELWAEYERFARFRLPLQLTEFDVDTRDEQLQADYLRDVMTITFSHPSFHAIMMWGFWEGRHWRPDGALWRKDWSIKPAGTMYKELVFKTWWTDQAGATGPGGTFKARGFLGQYRLTVTKGDQRRQQDLKLAPEGATVTIQLP